MSFLTVPRCVTTQDYHASLLTWIPWRQQSCSLRHHIHSILEKKWGSKAKSSGSKIKNRSKELNNSKVELIAAHTLAKLVAHVRLSLTKITFKETNLWTDSMATLHWLFNRGTWSRYVRNRVKAIKDLGKFTWRYVPTDQNPCPKSWAQEEFQLSS